MACNPNTLLASGKDFQKLSERDQQLAIAQLLCDISQNGPFWAVVFPDGSAVGPGGVINTSGTTTSGIQEAINSFSQETIYTGPASGGGTLILAPGRFNCTSQIVIPNNYPFDLSIKGSGKMLTLVNYNSSTIQDFIVTQRTLASPGDSAGYPSLNLSIRDCAFTYATTANKSAIFNLTYVNEALLVNCAFATLESFEVPGFGASLVYIDRTPRTKPGVVGFVLDSVSNGNIINFRNCAFYGLACGADISADHIRFEHTIFANIGMYWPTGSGAPTVGTQWAATVGVTPAVRRQNCYANGMALVRNGGVWEMDVHYCQWFFANILMGVYQNGFTMSFVLNPLSESTNMGFVSIGDGATQATADVGPGIVQMTSLNVGAPVAAGGYMNAQSGVVSGNNPRYLTNFIINPALNDADGSAPTLTIATASGSIFGINQNGIILRNLTKAQRNALSSISAGQPVYQTDNTPGQRVWNGTHWVRYTETNDD